MNITSGYQRFIPRPHPEAVAWWYVREYEDGYVYAQSGFVPTSREARKRIRDSSSNADRNHNRVIDRPTHTLTPNGDLQPIDYGPYGKVPARTQ